MPLPDWGASDLPPLLAFVVMAGGMALKFLKRGDEKRQSQWDQLRDLVADLRSVLKDKDDQIRQQDALIEQLQEDNLRLRRDLKDALRGLHHEREEPT